jgi:hypothetical protein
MLRKALIVWGGWEGHQPEGVAHVLGRMLEDEGFSVDMADTLQALEDRERLMELDLFVPVWTMGEISAEQCDAVSEAVASGVGLGGCHSMCDAFRSSVQWQFMTGGNWVAHPGGDGVEYVVNVRPSSSPIVSGLQDFVVRSEQYYLHVDPAVEVLATTRFPVAGGHHTSNGVVDMPVVWTKRWGRGRVFYCSLGHSVEVFHIPEVVEIVRRGLVWAAEGQGRGSGSGAAS